MTYKDNTPTYNVNRNVTNFGDFCKSCEEPKLKQIKRQTTPNSDERQKLPGNFKQKFNPVTRKIDNLSPSEINDKIDQLEESMVNESQVDYDILDRITNLEAYNRLKEEFRNALSRFDEELDNASGEIGYDEGITDHRRAYELSIQEIIGEIV